METVSITGVALVWGGILAVGMILNGVVFRVTKVHYSSRWSWGFYILPPAVALRVQLRHGGEAFGADIALAAMVIGVGCIAYGLFVFAYNRFVDDSLIRKSWPIVSNN